MPSVQEASFSELIARFYPLIDALRSGMANVQNLVSLLTTAGGQWWRNRADMEVGPQPAEGTPAIVWNDPVVANRGLYVRLGDALTGSWERMPYIFGSSVPLALLDPDVFAAFLDPLKGDVVQVIGRTGALDEGNPVADAMYIQAAPVSHDGAIGKLRVKLATTGDLLLARYIVSPDGTQIQRQPPVTITVTTVDPDENVFTPADFGAFPVNASDLIGLAGDGMFYGSPDFPPDAPGWRQINAAVDDWRPMPALQTAIRLEFSVEIDQHYQVVTGPAFQAVATQAADVDARATVLEAQAALLQADVVQVSGNPDALIPGAGVSDGMYVFADPIAHPGPLLTFDIIPNALGDFQIAKWYRVDGKIYRNALITLTATMVDVEQRFTPADFGDIVAAEGEYWAVHGNNVVAATSEPADGLGYWDVNAYATPRDIPVASTGNRLQVRFRTRQQYQAATANAVLDLQGRVTEIEDEFENIVGTPLFDGAMLPSPDWLSLTKDAFKAPLRGGMISQSLKRFQGRRTLAHLATVADTYNGAALGHSNVASDLAFCGSSSLRLHTVGAGGNPVPTAPAAANTAPTDVRGGIITFEFRPILNAGNGLDRWWLELHSSPSTPDNPSPNHHRIPIGSNSWLKSLMTSTAGAGRNQSSGIPVSCFAANGLGADLSAITWARFMTRAANGQTVEIEYGNIDWVPNPLSEGRLIVCADDGYIEQINWLAPNLRKRSMPGVIYPSPPAILVDVSGSYGSHNQLLTLQNRHGWQVAAQAWKNEAAAYWDTLDRNGKVAEFGKLANWWTAMGFADWGHGSLFSDVDMHYLSIIDAMQVHFHSVRGYFTGNYNPLDLTAPPFTFPEVYPWPDPMNIRALSVAGVTNANNGAWLRAHIQQTVDHKAVALIVLHKEQAANPNVATGFLSALDFAHDQRALGKLKICTVADLEHGYAV